MALSKFKFCAVTAIAIAALTGVVVQHRAVARLRQETRSLRDRVETLTAANELAANPISDATADTNELATLRENQSELLRLRAEVTALRRAQLLIAQTASKGNAAAASGASETSPAATRLQASVRAQVATGQTLLTGGWTNESGSRIFVMATPRIEGDNADQVGIKTTVFEVSADALSRIGLEGFRADGTESSLQQIFGVDQANLLLKQLKDTDGARLLAQTSLLTTDGRQAQVQTQDEQLVDGENHSLGPSIDIVPVISSDKSAIDMTLRAGVNRPSSKP